MKVKIKSLSEEENEVVSALSDKMEEKQKEIDELLEIYTKLKEPIEEVKEQIKTKRAELSPIAELKASVVSAESRDKYHPEDTKASILEKAKKVIK